MVRDVFSTGVTIGVDVTTGRALLYSISSLVQRSSMTSKHCVMILYQELSRNPFTNVLKSSLRLSGRLLEIRASSDKATALILSFFFSERP